jgi:hypothetical protein
MGSYEILSGQEILLSLFTYYSRLTKRSFAVTNGNSGSSRYLILAGSPKGNLLVPTLFKIYINITPIRQNDNNMAVSLYAQEN